MSGCPLEFSKDEIVEIPHECMVAIDWNAAFFAKYLNLKEMNVSSVVVFPIGFASG